MNGRPGLDTLPAKTNWVENRRVHEYEKEHSYDSHAVDAGFVIPAAFGMFSVFWSLTTFGISSGRAW